MDRHSEVEVKFNARGLSWKAVQKFLHEVCKTTPEGYKFVHGQDDYWHRDTHIVRHRFEPVPGGSNVLTVKSRKSQDQIADRHEIDLPLEALTPSRSVTAFLKATGWKRDFTIVKDSHIETLVFCGVKVVVALYTVFPSKNCKVTEPLTFLEIEVEKDNRCEPLRGLATLYKISKATRKRFKLDRPLNSSLYELYSTRFKGDVQT